MSENRPVVPAGTARTSRTTIPRIHRLFQILVGKIIFMQGSSCSVLSAQCSLVVTPDQKCKLHACCPPADDQPYMSLEHDLRQPHCIVGVDQPLLAAEWPWNIPWEPISRRLWFRFPAVLHLLWLGFGSEAYPYSIMSSLSRDAVNIDRALRAAIC